jgi:N-acetylmuramoyl-L-alanine amidase
MNLLIPSSSRLLRRLHAAILLSALALALPAAASAQTAGALYERAVKSETDARAAGSPAALRSAATAFENIVRRYPRSGFCDNALWQAAGLMLTAFEASSEPPDRTRAEKLLRWLRDEYPHSALVPKAVAQLSALAVVPATAPATEQTPPPESGTASAASAPVPPEAPLPSTLLPTEPAPAGDVTSSIKRITQSDLPRGDRITIEMTQEVPYWGDRVSNPDRIYVDFASTTLPASLEADTSRLSGRLVTGLRIGKQANGAARVVLEVTGHPRYSAFPLYNPFRLVVDVEADAPLPVVQATARPAQQTPASEPVLPVTPSASPAPPAVTSKGDYSLARQLGLSVSRIVIDAGHGGHDPGAQANGVTEADLVLDIAKRVQALLSAQPGFDVVLTRSTDEFIPLEQRTAIANREDADMFLSIHANASRQPAAHGIETYFLNFATNPDAEAVAARENASSTRTMGTLPETISAIATNSKIQESRELATIVQTSMVRRLAPQNRNVRDLGVKQAPFVVLIGTQMPAVLAEISFVTNKLEAGLLKQSSYRDRIAKALADAVVKYQASLKKVITVANRNEGR